MDRNSSRQLKIKQCKIRKMFEKKKLTIYSDGGARGNPGPAATGFVVYQDGQPIVKLGKTIGRATNNVAEYQAVIEALNWLAQNLKGKTFLVNHYVDSQLIVNQLNGLYKIKNAKLRVIILKIKELEQELRQKFDLEIIYSYIPREKNTAADQLVNQALDQTIIN